MDVRRFNWNKFRKSEYFPHKNNRRRGGGGCISDNAGNLLFYTGYKPAIGLSRFYNSLNELIENGDSLRYLSDDGQIFLKRPTNDKKYYMFHTHYIQVGFTIYELVYQCLIDMMANDEKGEVIHKNKILYYNESRIDAKLAACKHSDGKSWWLLFYERSQARFVRFLVKGDTIMGPDFQSFPNMTPFGFPQYYSEMLFSPSGTQLAFGSREPLSYSCFLDTISLEVYDFDRCTGLLDNRHIIFKRLTCDSSISNAGYADSYSMAFSPDEQILYFNTLDSLYQLDLTQDYPYLTRKCLDNFNVSQDGLLHTSPRQMELGPNGKIYISYFNSYNDSIRYYLGVISEPNKPYPACNYTRQGLYLEGHKSDGFLPNMPNYNLQGLPYSVCGPARFIACGDSAQIGAPRQSCQFYSWAPAAGLSDSAAANPKAAPQFTTTYTLTTYIDGSDQTDTDTVTVHVTPFPNGYITAAPQEFSGPPFTVHFKALGADTSGLSFHWDFGDQTTGQNAITSHEYPAIDGYLVKLFIQDASGTCKDTIAYFLKLSLITRINELKTKENSFRLYPNPAEESVTIEHDLLNATVEISTPLGKIIHSQNALKPKTVIDLRPFAKGIYYLRIYTNLNQNLAIKKLIIY